MMVVLMMMVLMLVLTLVVKIDMARCRNQGTNGNHHVLHILYLQHPAGILCRAWEKWEHLHCSSSKVASTVGGAEFHLAPP